MIDRATLAAHARQHRLECHEILLWDRDCVIVRILTDGNGKPATPENRCALQFAFYNRGPQPISGSAVFVRLGTEDLSAADPVAISLHESPAAVISRVESAARGRT